MSVKKDTLARFHNRVQLPSHPVDENSTIVYKRVSICYSSKLFSLSRFKFNRLV